MWDHLPASELQSASTCDGLECLRYANRGRLKDGIGQVLDRLVAEEVLYGWVPISVETELGFARRWKITPTHGPAQLYDRVGIEAFLRMVDLCTTTSEPIAVKRHG